MFKKTSKTFLGGLEKDLLKATEMKSPCKGGSQGNLKSLHFNNKAEESKWEFEACFIENLLGATQAVFLLIIAEYGYRNGLLCTLTTADFQIDKALI